MTDFLDSRQLKLLEFVKEQHGSQVRKYDDEPYWNHLVRVAFMVKDKGRLLCESALCHDLFEDTSCDSDRLFKNLLRFGYSVAESNEVCSRVEDLTDFYTSEQFPDLNRKERKKKEAERLSQIGKGSQTVKCADLIDNLRSIVRHDKDFAKVYIQEKKNILRGFHYADFDIYYQAIGECYIAEKELENG